MGRGKNKDTKKVFLNKIKRLWRASCRSRNKPDPIENVSEDFLYSKTYLLDFKNQSGRWATSGRLNGRNMQTRAFSIWQSIRQRTREGGVYQTKWRAYRGVTMSNEWSESFQSFANWYTSQIGYEEGWDVDKDALSNKREYSAATCILLPREVNNLFSSRNLVFNIRLVRYQSGESKYCAKGNIYFISREKAVDYCLGMRMSRISELEQKYKDMIPALIFTKLRQIDYLSINLPSDLPETST